MTRRRSHASSSSGSSGIRTLRSGPRRSSSCGRSGSSRMRPVKTACALVVGTTLLTACAEAPAQHAARLEVEQTAERSGRSGDTHCTPNPRLFFAQGPKAERASSAWSRWGGVCDRYVVDEGAVRLQAGSGLHPSRHMTAAGIECPGRFAPPGRPAPSGARRGRSRSGGAAPRGAAVASLVDGRRLLSARAVGKNLLLEFDGDVVVRSHLRMRGRWSVVPAGLEAGRPAMARAARARAGSGPLERPRP